MLELVTPGAQSVPS
uniref:Uncharacterized protein n=1 Tax=Arundo donax TaxID=35708 RepID=A0A0A9BC36_ARUDO